MLQRIKNLLVMDEHVLRIVRFGFKLSIFIWTLAITILLIYSKYYISHDLFEGGFILFRTGLLFAIQFLICGIVISQIKKQMN